jgi:hypothetical protein
LRKDFAILIVVFAFLIASPLAVVGNSTTQQQTPVHIAIPLDTSSPAVWTRAIEGAPAVGLIVYNPSSGPGTHPDPGFANTVSRAQQAGIKVVGYVDTRYANGNVSINSAEKQIDDYFNWYKVDGIFFDQSNSSCASRASEYYSILFQYAKARSSSAPVVLNPGTTPGQCYVWNADMILTFENTFAKYRDSFVPSDWTAQYPRDMFCHLVLGAPNETAMKWSINAGVGRGVGWMFVTSFDTTKGNPYDSLPPYFEQEVAYVNSIDGFDNQWGFPGGIYFPLVLIVAGLVASSLIIIVKARVWRVAKVT